MTIPARILLAICIVLGVSTLGFVIYSQVQIKNQQTAIQTQMTQQQQLVDGIMKSGSTFATKQDLQQFATDNQIDLKAIQASLAQLNSQLSAINVITADSTGQDTGSLPTTSIGPANPKPPTAGGGTVICTGPGLAVCPSEDQFGYQKAQQNLAVNEDFGTGLKVPFGTVGFSAWQQNPWDVNIASREYNVSTTVGIDANEKQTFYNKFSVDVNGKTYDIPIKTATTKQAVISPTFSFWNPRILMGIDGGININHIKGEFTPSVNLGIMSWGTSKLSPDLSVLEVGVGYGVVNKTAEVSITPIAYNIGKKLFSPLMNNTYIGPSVSVATDGSFGVGAGLRVGF